MGSSKYREYNYTETNPRETIFGSSYRGFWEIEGSRNLDSTVCIFTLSMAHSEIRDVVLCWGTLRGSNNRRTFVLVVHFSWRWAPRWIFVLTWWSSYQIPGDHPGLLQSGVLQHTFFKGCFLIVVSRVSVQRLYSIKFNLPSYDEKLVNIIICRI